MRAQYGLGADVFDPKNGNKLYVKCDFLVGAIGGIEWNDPNQRDDWGMPPSPLLTDCA